ncbi:acyl transferase/acyl hydrolase/lysophospholipase [Collybia nuda]|uniref:Acyl transferase/acyl hydrolase/lysophospholipase n=1 Tax=Collybia nuda TaxID=64659 RepID=A0A9P5YDA7_9AGAR|nr:acyl transferase/acyl hydrolase/lysophospholipase [Collybia nuda]
MSDGEQSDLDETICEETKPSFVLSIDGGGFRGLSCLLVIAHLMQEIGLAVNEDDPPRPYQVFDLICGTSTGGLIAILLGRFGLSCDEAIEVYREIGTTMFNGEADAGKIWGNIIHGEQFSSAIFEKKLEEIVARYTGSKDTLVKPPKTSPDTHYHESTQTFVTVVSRVGSAGVDAYRIRSYPRPLDDIDPSPYGHKWSIFEAIRGTCAAPMYLSPLKVQQGHGIFVFQDAGFSGFNNPSTVALDEAEKLFGLDADIKLISLGTGLRSLVGEGKHPGTSQDVKDEDIKSVVQMILNSVSTVAKNAKNAPQLARRVAKQLLEVATDTELTHLHTYEQFDREYN